MNEEMILKMKYRNLRRNVINIRNKVNNLQSLSNDLESIMKQTLYIDNHIVLEDTFKKVKKDIQNINNELSSRVIPMINNKC